MAILFLTVASRYLESADLLGTGLFARNLNTVPGFDFQAQDDKDADEDMVEEESFCVTAKSQPLSARIHKACIEKDTDDHEDREESSWRGVKTVATHFEACIEKDTDDYEDREESSWRGVKTAETHSEVCRDTDDHEDREESSRLNVKELAKHYEALHYLAWLERTADDRTSCRGVQAPRSFAEKYEDLDLGSLESSCWEMQSPAQDDKDADEDMVEEESFCVTAKSQPLSARIHKACIEKDTDDYEDREESSWRGVKTAETHSEACKDTDDHEDREESSWRDVKKLAKHSEALNYLAWLEDSADDRTSCRGVQAPRSFAEKYEAQDDEDADDTFCSIVKSQSLSAKIHEELGDAWKLEFSSPYLAHLFNFKDTDIAKHASTSFCRNLLETIDLESHLKRIRQTFSKSITVKRKFSADHQKDEPVICVLEVDVDYRNDKITVSEKDLSQKESFLELNCEKETLVIWVHSKSVQVFEAVSLVYKKYEALLNSKPILIHHVLEENEDLCKKICIQKLEALNKIIMSLSDCIPVSNLREIVDATATITLSEDNIRQLCYNVFLEYEGTNVGTTSNCSYPCSNLSILNRMKEQLINKTLEAIFQSFVEEICTEIFTNIESKVKTNLNTESLKVKINIEPELFAMATYDTEYDVNSVPWRTKIADQIYEKVCMNRALIEGDILPQIETMCTKTKEDLQDVSKQINDLKQKIGFPDQETLIQEWNRRRDFPNKQELMKKYPSVLNYIAGQKDGKTILKVVFEKKDDEAEKFLRDNCCISADTDFDFIYANDFIKETQLPKKPPTVDKQIRLKLKKIIQAEEDKIIALYSTVVGIGVGRTMLSETEFGDPCIVLYCLDRNLVPFGEKKIPKMFKGCIVDIREDFFMFGSCIDCMQLENGCCIGRAGEISAGSVGMFVKLNCSSTTTDCGFLTAAHVAYGNILELNKSATLVNGDFHQIVHPVMSGNVVGNVTKAFCGNRKTNEYEKGIDAAFVHFAEQENKELPVLHIVNEDDVESTESTFVSKKGISTNTTIGLLSQNTMSVEIKGIWFKNCFIIYNYKAPFFKEGDSGSGVFLSDADGQRKRALGIAFGLSNSKTQTCVCDIRDIVQTFGIAFYSQPQPMDTSFSS